jgi:hypothetical protein
MAKKKAVEKNGKFGDAEGYIKSLVIDNEYKIAAANNQQQYADYESILDMIELVRGEKNYSWQSDIFIGHLLSHMLTEASSWAAVDFQSRDFVDIYLEGNQPDDKHKAKAAKILLNALLNIKDVYHYHKRIRGRTINWIFGQVYMLMWWEQKVVTRKIPQQPRTEVQRGFDSNGDPTAKVVEIPQEPREVEEVIFDRMNYEVFDARNAFTDASFTYSAQEKPWITLRSVKRFSQLKDDQERMQYFNLDVLEEKIYGGTKDKKPGSTPETDTSKESFNKLGGAYSPKQETLSKVDPDLDILDRYGKIWAVVKERDDGDNPTEIEPGYKDGKIKDKAELVEAIITYAGIGGNFTLIGFKPTWAIDAYGRPFKPIIRGWCYIHPTKDIGLSDGKNLREMNIAMNDTFNLNNDRTMLATLPMFKGRRDALENNPTIFIEPENVMLMENPEKDLLELIVKDNIQGGMAQMNFIRGISSEMDAVYTTTEGGLPEKTSTTATAVSGSAQKTATRANLKGLTWTYTVDVEFYWMIQQLVYRNMRYETLEKILGKELVQYFDPRSDYTYVSLSQNLENEHQKQKKVSTYDQIQGRLAGLAKIIPQAIPKAAAYIFGKQMELLGSEYREVAHIVDQIANAKPVEEKGAEQVKDMKDEAATNQTGVPQSPEEIATRGMPK